MKNAGNSKKAREEGIAIAREMLESAKELAQGACIMPQLGKFDMVEKILY